MQTGATFGRLVATGSLPADGMYQLVTFSTQLDEPLKRAPETCSQSEHDIADGMVSLCLLFQLLLQAEKLRPTVQASVFKHGFQTSLYHLNGVRLHAEGQLAGLHARCA